MGPEEQLMRRATRRAAKRLRAPSALAVRVLGGVAIDWAGLDLVLRGQEPGRALTTLAFDTPTLVSVFDAGGLDGELGVALDTLQIRSLASARASLSGDDFVFLCVCDTQPRDFEKAALVAVEEIVRELASELLTLTTDSGGE